jgi:hypothetical protein
LFPHISRRVIIVLLEFRNLPILGHIMHIPMRNLRAPLVLPFIIKFLFIGTDVEPTPTSRFLPSAGDVLSADCAARFLFVVLVAADHKGTVKSGLCASWVVYRHVFI